MKAATAPSQERSLDRHVIIQEAIALLNEKGMGNFSMRALAARLGISAPSLYWHFPNKAAIIQAIGEHLFAAGVDTLPKTGNWQEWMRRYGRAHWRVQKTVSFTTLMLMSPSVSQATMIEHNIALMRSIIERFPIDNEILMKIQGEVQAIVFGWSVLYHSQAREFVTPIYDNDFDSAVFSAIDRQIAGWALELKDR